MIRIVVLLLSMWAVSSHAMDELHLLHQLHTQAYQNMSHYYMFSALEGDNAFSEKLTDGLLAMNKNIEQLSSSQDPLVQAQMDLVSIAFKSLEALVTENQQYFIKKGYAEGQRETEMSQANNQLANQLQLAYQQLVTANQDKPTESVTESRNDAILLSQMVATYAAHALNNPTLMLNDRHKGRPLDELAKDFNRRITLLGKMVKRPDSLRQFKSAKGKWRMVSEPMEKYRQNAMPHLVHKYSNAIVNELNYIAQLESKPFQ